MYSSKTQFIVKTLLHFMVFSSLCNNDSLRTLNANLGSLSNIQIPSIPHQQAGRKIGILAWGSLVNDPRDLKTVGRFQKSSLKLPIQLSRLSGEGTDKQRLTRIIDKDLGMPISIWHSVSHYNTLPDARENLRVREGTTLPNIFYIKTMLPSKAPDQNEKPILDEHRNNVKDANGNKWYIINTAENKISPQNRIDLAKWASTQGYDAVIWTGLGKKSNYETFPKIKAVLNDRRTLENTKVYILNLPDQNELTEFEKKIITNQLN